VPELLQGEQDAARGRARDAREVGDLAQRQRRPLAREDLDHRHAAFQGLQRLLSLAVRGTHALGRLGHWR
jgi:hypothetical protein